MKLRVMETRNLDGIPRSCVSIQKCEVVGGHDLLLFIRTKLLLYSACIFLLNLSKLSSSNWLLTFTRKECDRLMEIIKSRVTDGSTMEEEKDGKLGGIFNRTVGDGTDFTKFKV